MVFTNCNHPMTDQCNVTLRQWWPLTGAVKAEVGCKISSFVNQFLPSAKLVHHASIT